MLLVKVSNYKHFYSIDVSGNLVSEAFLQNIKDFLKNNNFCTEFKNALFNKNNTNTIYFTEISLLQKNVISILDLSNIDLNSCLTTISNFLKNTKQIETLNVASCNLSDDDLKDFLDSIVSETSYNTIIHLDISNNKITKERHFFTLRAKLLNSCF